jgi:hypothetical protein
VLAFAQVAQVNVEGIRISVVVLAHQVSHGSGGHGGSWLFRGRPMICRQRLSFFGDPVPGGIPAALQHSGQRGSPIRLSIPGIQSPAAARPQPSVTGQRTAQSISIAARWSSLSLLRSHQCSRFHDLVTYQSSRPRRTKSSVVP